jgi:hypothetical protein
MYIVRMSREGRKPFLFAVDRYPVPSAVLRGEKGGGGRNEIFISPDLRTFRLTYYPNVRSLSQKNEIALPEIYGPSLQPRKTDIRVRSV